MSNSADQHSGLIAWFARNPIAANLLMISILLVGLSSTFATRKQMFPQAQSTWIDVSIPFYGASPMEVEESVTVKIEQALTRLQDIERVVSYSNRGGAVVRIKIRDRANPEELLAEVKNTIDTISSFPEAIERPIIKLDRYRQEVMYLGLSGDLPYKQLKSLGQEIYDELRTLPEVQIVDYQSGPNYEIYIEVDKHLLREHNLSLQQIAQALRAHSVTGSAGQVRTDTGVLSVLVEQQAYIAAEYEKIPIKNLEDGSKLQLSDVATISDGLEDKLYFARIDGKSSVVFFIGATDDQSITNVAATVNEFINQRQQTLPQGVQLEPWIDFTDYLESRLGMMIKNMLYGGLLVFIVLTIFLQTRVAFWVMMGLPVSFLGAMACLQFPWIDVSINVVSLFAFIMVLGIVVDDAIIIGESIHTQTTQYGHSIDQVVQGVHKVATPATFGVLTSIAAFLPLAFTTGPNAHMPNAIGFVVIFCLLFSLVESKWILPAHLSKQNTKSEVPKGRLANIQKSTDAFVGRFTQNNFAPFLRSLLTYRYAVVSFFIGLVLITTGLVISGHIRYHGIPNIPHDYTWIELETLPNAPKQEILDNVQRLEAMIQSVEEEVIAGYGQPMVDKVMVEVFDQNKASVRTRLVSPEDRPISTFQLTDLWRESMPKLNSVKSFSIIDTLFGIAGVNDGDVSFLIQSHDEHQLVQATNDLKQRLSQLTGVEEINDSEQRLMQDVKLALKPLATTMGFTLDDVSRQVAFSLYGVEAQRIVRDQQELRVLVRYPEHQRNSIHAVQQVVLTSPNGSQIPLSDVAEIEVVKGTSQIYREDGRRAITVWASIDDEVTEPLTIANYIQEYAKPDLAQIYPAVKIDEAGKLKDERADLAKQLQYIVLILIPIYVLLALPLKSYLQPLLIMSVIPFGIVGSIYGHWLLGLDLSQMSLFGILAVIGVVVNDSLVLIDFANRLRLSGVELITAAVEAATKRFRAIVLTSLTTFIGLIPIISETSLQAKIVIPMAVSLAFGVLFATMITLIFLPCLYVMLGDLRLSKTYQTQTDDNKLRLT